MKTLSYDNALHVAKLALLEGLVDAPRYVKSLNGLAQVDDKQRVHILAERLNLSTAAMQALHSLAVRRITPTDDPTTTVSGTPNHTPRYVLGDEIGRGGSARVVLAEDRLIHRNVAMKILYDKLDDAETRLSRFLTEAQLTGMLAHPNIMPVYDIGVLAGGEMYFTMKYVGDNNLRLVLHYLRHAPKKAKDYGLIRLLTMFNQLCMAVDYAHDAGVVHRDLKPENILLGDHGEVILTDWGIARMIDDESELVSRPHNTPASTVIGTPEYMAPEQALGRQVGRGADIYALGCLLYELLCLETPFEAEKPVQILVRTVKDRPEPPSVKGRRRNRDVPAELEAICLHALEKKPEDRFLSAKALSAAVESWIEGRRNEERIRELADTRMRDAERHARMYEDKLAELRPLRLQLQELELRYEGWEPLSDKQEWIVTERKVLELESMVVGIFGEAEAAFMQTLAYNRDSAAARSGLANLYWRRLQQAESEDDRLGVVRFSQLVRLYDNGQLADNVRGLGSVSIESVPPGADVRIVRLEEEDLILRPASERHAGETPSHETDVPMGSYVARLEHPEAGSATINFRVNRCEHVRLRVPLAVPALSDDFIYVPPGPARIGGDPGAIASLPPQNVSLGGFYLSRYPVTLAEYLEFINALESLDPELAITHMPRTPIHGIMCRKSQAGHYEPIDTLFSEQADRYRPGQGHEWFLPVFGVNLDNVTAYLRWRSQRDNRTYRLPTELEWEKASRGGDGRKYPWGNRFDPTLCKMGRSRPEAPSPEPVGVFETDQSPYGVRDLAGGVREWTSDVFARPSPLFARRLQRDPEMRHFARVCKGGAWNLDEHFARAASRSAILPDTRDPSIGFRLAADIH